MVLCKDLNNITRITKFNKIKLTTIALSMKIILTNFYKNNTKRSKMTISNILLIMSFILSNNIQEGALIKAKNLKKTFRMKKDGKI